MSYDRKTTDQGIMVAFAQRFAVHVKVVEKIGTAQLCRCKSDLARRILLRAVEAESLAGAGRKQSTAREGSGLTNRGGSEHGTTIS